MGKVIVFDRLRVRDESVERLRLISELLADIRWVEKGLAAEKAELERDIIEQVLDVTVN